MLDVYRAKGKVMTNTKIFRDHHDELLSIATKVSAFLSEEKLKESASEVRGLLSKLFAKLGIHLAMEDKALYPKLLGSSDEKIRTMAKQFMDEMGGIGEAVGNYKKKWPTHFSIEQSPNDFIKETEGLFEALGNRIEKENSQLYKMVDELD